jgi:hypothetical protein
MLKWQQDKPNSKSDNVSNKDGTFTGSNSFLLPAHLVAFAVNFGERSVGVAGVRFMEL